MLTPKSPRPTSPTHQRPQPLIATRLSHPIWPVPPKNTLFSHRVSIDQQPPPPRHDTTPTTTTPSPPKPPEMHLMYIPAAPGVPTATGSGRTYTLKKTLAGQVTKSAHPARFSPDDKWSRHRTVLRSRFAVLLEKKGIAAPSTFFLSLGVL